jgi:putative glutamine amidotransferase
VPARPARPRRPRIGITTYHRSGSERLAFSLPSAYVDGVRRGGGLPLLLPPGETDPQDLLHGLDGVVFGGGGDLDATHFGGASHATNYFVDAERDAFELALMEHALAAAVPVLAICRGMQLLNVVRGGGLHGHLPDVVGTAVEHRESQQRHIEHPVRIEPDSHLGRILQAEELVIASWHHQGVDRLGEGLRPVAWAPDGTVEALEDPGRPELLAVQWHPELQLHADSPQDRLFRAFVELCRKSLR